MVMVVMMDGFDREGVCGHGRYMLDDVVCCTCIYHNIIPTQYITYFN